MVVRLRRDSLRRLVLEGRGWLLVGAKEVGCGWEGVRRRRAVSVSVS